jgi:hypothetical protein
VRDRLTAIGSWSAAISSGTNQPTAALAAVESWPTQPTVALLPADGASDELGATGRHRTMAPGLPWHRRRVSGWVMALVVLALITAVLAAVALTSGEGPGTPAGALPPPLVVASPEAEATAVEPDSAPEPVRSTVSPAPSSPTPVAVPTTPARARPVDQISGLAAIVRQQAEAGLLRPKAARAMLRDLNEVLRHLAAGETGKAAESFAEFRDRVTEIRADGDFTGALPDLGRIAESIG